MAYWEETETPDETELALIMPHQELVTMQWAFHFRQYNLPPHKYFMNRGWPWDVARTDMVKGALKHNPKWLFFLDSDTYHKDPNAIMALMQIAEQKNLDIVSGLYWAKKRGITTPCAWIKKDVEGKPRNPQFLLIDKVEEHIEKNDIIEVSVAGLGFCIIRASVFHKWDEVYGDKPYFRWGIGLKEDEQEKLDIYNASEDFNFFLRCGEMGCSPFVACGIVCGHIGEAAKTDKEGKLDFLEL